MLLLKIKDWEIDQQMYRKDNGEWAQAACSRTKELFYARQNITDDNLEKQRTFGVVSNCKVPFGDLSLGVENLDPARVKTAGLRLARISKG